MSPEERQERIEKMVAQDARYREMLQENRDLEQRFDRMVSMLSISKRDLIWDFVMQCEEMSRYVLELACNNMVFPEE